MVDLYPWGAKKLSPGRRENKPIFLSIGYSTCHWCMFMAQRIIRKREVAAIMNASL